MVPSTNVMASGAALVHILSIGFFSVLRGFEARENTNHQRLQRVATGNTEPSHVWLLADGSALMQGNCVVRMLFRGERIADSGAWCTGLVRCAPLTIR